MKRWQAVVFDMDDTLYPEEMYVLSGFRAVAQWGETHLGIGATEGYAYLEDLFFSGVRHDTFDRWLLHFELIDPTANAEQVAVAVAPFITVYREHQPILKPFPEVPELLSQLTVHYRLGLVSDGYLAVQQRKWSALNLETCFTAVVFSDQWGREAWKPSTLPFTEVLRLLAVAPQNAVYIGDNPLKDFRGAREVGMASIWLRRREGQYASQTPPATYEPDQIIESWKLLGKELLSGK